MVRPARVSGSLPAEALVALEVARARTLARGQIWWLPAEHVHYRGKPKGRYCLLVALEGTPDGQIAQGYFVAGTSQRATGPAIIIEIGDTNLIKRTEFDFSVAWPLAASEVARSGNYVDEISPRLGEIDRAIGQTTTAELIAVKRVLSS